MDLDEIKKLTLRGIMADDILMHGLILKGGNALQLAYDITNRGSVDIDFSMDKEFSQKEFERIGRSFGHRLNSVFNEKGIKVYDIKFSEKPKEGKIPQWKGYQLEFKLIDMVRFIELGDDMGKIRMSSIKVKDQSPKFTVDISAYEFVEGAVKRDIDGLILKVYTPEMILIEKLRALCQSMEEYRSIVGTSNLKQRARDVYDIHIIKQSFKKLNINKELVDNIFEAKKVPVSFLKEMETLRERNRAAWPSVEQTISAREELKEYDFYFDEMIETVNFILSL